ncbi:MAG: hypothetical protein CMB99_16600 [Flavobacteriaceae bacterium]|nr:hypothetical protein [Flavobacteriaceae bacterium]|tara:strand:+ start:5637 stop:6788 length:1152 start_codon:yes stop_codon:yes gene_type:complete
MKPGVYLDMAEADYFEPDAKGSTDLATLHENGEGWWWQSRHNPEHIPYTSDAATFGSALHALLLEGRDAFESRYFVMPDKSEYDDLVDTVDDLKSAIDAAGGPAPGAKAKKDNLLEMARMYCPERNVWAWIVEEAQKEAAGRHLITRQDEHDLEAMVDAIARSPEAQELLLEPAGERLPEVSVFDYVRLDPETPGVLCRFRFDGLYPQVSLDLKSVQSSRSTFDDEVRFRIRSWKFKIQCGWSFYMRQRAYALIQEGKVFGGTKAQRDWLKRFPAAAPMDKVRWTWIFYQRPSNTGIAPTIMPVVMEPPSVYIDKGYSAALGAIRLYADRLKEFGLEHPWSRAMPAKLAIDAEEWEDGNMDESVAMRIPRSNNEPLNIQRLKL